MTNSVMMDENQLRPAETSSRDTAVTTEATLPVSSVSEHERVILQPWFELTALDKSSEEWMQVWAALTSPVFARPDGLAIWPAAVAEVAACSSPETRTAQVVQLALEAGVLYSQQFPAPTTRAAEGGATWPAAAGLVPMSPSLGVEMVLGLLHKHTELTTSVLTLPRQARVQRIFEEISAHVVGVFLDAPMALAAELTLLRATDPSRREDRWPPLVELILREASNDEVFAEYVFLQMQATGVGDVDFLVLPSGHWMVLRTTKVAQASPESSGNATS